MKHCQRTIEWLLVCTEVFEKELEVSVGQTTRFTSNFGCLSQMVIITLEGKDRVLG